MNIFYTPQFLRNYKQLSISIREKAKEKEKIFRINPFDLRLKTHKLQGELRGCWAFSVDFKYRIIFTFETKNKSIFHAVGSHSIYF